MAGSKISALSAAAAALLTHEFAVNEGGVNKKVTTQQVADLFDTLYLAKGALTNKRIPVANISGQLIDSLLQSDVTSGAVLIDDGVLLASEDLNAFINFGSGTDLSMNVGGTYVKVHTGYVDISYNSSEGQLIIDNDRSQLFHDTEVLINAPLILIDTLVGGSMSLGGTNAVTMNYGNSGTTHNFMGMAVYEYVGNAYITDKCITLNDGGAAGSGSGVGFEIEENAVITGWFKTNAARNGYEILAPTVAYHSTYTLTGLTAHRTHTVPDDDGTFLLEDNAAIVTNKIYIENDLAIGVLDIDWALSNQFYKTITANSVFTFSNLSNGECIRVVVAQDGTGGWTVTWPVGVLWSGGVAPVQTATASKEDVYTFIRSNGKLYGSVIQNF